MDYYQGVVTEYLRADRGVFLNPEFFLQLQPGASPPKGTSWYVDAVAVDLRYRQAFLVEISFSQTLAALRKRLAEWRLNWPGIRAALERDAGIPAEWPVRPWLFVPESLVQALVTAVLPLTEAPDGKTLPMMRITPLEMTQPWRFCSWDRQAESIKPDSVPACMQE